MGGPEGLSEVSLSSPHTQASLSSQPCPPPPGAGQSLPPDSTKGPHPPALDMTALGLCCPRPAL